ncbi:KR domain-containing protein [Rhizobium changzhiense]|uniref:beta-ketoacyl synthase N-terminal-like domain-containing protein n=1 Tax=Rhizobium changzhiense TaxID=2692317 RepID=UPI001F0CC030|nr:beta-ketoacyl synthase N-terminal-like domain-containing protein [Rhizobium changzhiense]MCH4547472.1 KR domain-containing protein [Rhizobium changzhiense]
MDTQLVAVIGAALRYPGSISPEGFWQNLLKGSTAVRFNQNYTPDLSNPRASDYVSADLSLDDADQFAASYFGFAQREAELIDPQQRLFLECCWELLQRTGYGKAHSRPLTGLFAGASLNTYLANILKREVDPMSVAGTELMLANDKDYMTGRVSYKLGLNGPSVGIQTGCSTSLVAVHHAVESLLRGECDIAIAGGVAIHAMASRPGYLPQPGLMLSTDGHCRPFDKNASGTVFGDGVGAVALRPLRDALKSGDDIIGVIRGTATNNDGADRIGFTAPSVSGQISLITAALSRAGVDPISVGYLEAHGTATPLGDPIEFAALNEIFSGLPNNSCGLGSVKANIGHSAAAAGVAGLIKTLMAVRSGQIPPHPTFTTAHPNVDLQGSPFFINTQTVDWPSDGVRVAGISSFGMGGTNAHVIVENPPARGRASKPATWRLLPVSAASNHAAVDLREKIEADLAAGDEWIVDDAALSLQDGRESEQGRQMIIARSAGDIYRTSGEPANGSRVICIAGLTELAAELSNSPDYAKSLATQFKAIRDEIFGEAGELTSTEAALGAQVIDKLAALRCILGLFAQSVSVVLDDDAALLLPVVTGEKTVSQAVTGRDRGSDLAAFYIKDADFDDEGQILSFAPRPLAEAPSNVFRLDFAPAVEPLSGLEKQSINCPKPPALLRLIAQLWSDGHNIRWARLDDIADAIRRPFPIQTLERKRCWYTANHALESRELAAGGGLFAEAWKSAERLDAASPPVFPARTLLLDNEDFPLSKEIQESLVASGAKFDIVRIANRSGKQENIYHVDPASPDAAKWLVAELEDAGAPINHIVSLWGLGQSRSLDTALQSDVYFQFELVRLLPETTPLRLTVCSRNAVDVLGEGVDNPWATAMLGAMRALSQELTFLQVRFIDVDRSIERLGGSKRLLSQIFNDDTKTSLVALRNGLSWHQEFVRLPQRSVQTIPQSFVCVITGGLGHIGSLVAEALGKHYGAKLILVSRHPVQSKEQRDNSPNSRWVSIEDRKRIKRLQRLEKLGIDFEILVDKMISADEFGPKLAEIETRLNVRATAFVHAAGPSGEAAIHWISKSDRADWERLIRGKTRAAITLAEFFSQREIFFGCFISSLSVELGGGGLAPYAAGNRICDALVHHFPNKPYLALDVGALSNWKPDVGVGRGVFTDDEFSEAFEQSLRHLGQRRILLSRFDPAQVVAGFKSVPAASTTVTSVTESQAEKKQRLLAVWRNVLGEQPDDDSNFFDIGGDSLAGIGLVADVNKAFARTFTVADLYDMPTVNQMVKRL